MASTRLTTETTGVDTAPGIGPKGVAVNDSGTKTSGSQLGPVTDVSPDYITQESEFHTEASGRFDARGDSRVLLTVANFGAGDTLTLTVRMHDGTDVTIGPITHGTAAESDWQTAARSALPGTDLTVVTGTANSHMTFAWNNAEFYGRRFPKIRTVTGTGGASGVVTRVVDPATKRYLGETKYEGSTELVGPTLGTITVTPGVDEVQSIAFSAGTDGGAYELGFRKARTGSLAWDADVATVKTAVQAMFSRIDGFETSYPTVRWVTPLSLEIIFSAGGADFTATDSAILTYNTTDASDALVASVLTAPTSAAEREALVVAWVKTIDAFASHDVKATEVTEDKEYDVVFHTSPQTTIANTDFALDVTGSADEDATPDQNTAFSREAGIAFTFENGVLAGRPVRGGLRVHADTLEDGGVLEPLTFAVGTAGVLGSISAAYTEQSTVGDQVFAEARNDSTGKTYGAQKDATSPLTIASLPPGVYTLVARTIANRELTFAGIARTQDVLSAPSTKAFTVTSA